MTRAPRLTKLRPIDLVSNSTLVKDITSDIRKALKPILNDKAGELKNCGMRDWEQPVELDGDTGFWRNKSMIGKPKRWILHATPSSDGRFRVHLPDEVRGAEHIGYFSNVSGTMMIMSQRIIIGVKDLERESYTFNDKLEWVLFIAMRQPLPRGTSCEIIKNLDLAAGTLGYEGQANIQSAKVAALCLVPPLNEFGTKQPKALHDSLVKFLEKDSTVPLIVIDNPKSSSSAISDFCSACEANIFDPTPESDNFKTQLSNIKNSAYLTDGEEQQISYTLKQGHHQIVLWGPDSMRMSIIRDNILDRLNKKSSHIVANQAWTEGSILRVIRSLNTEILSFEQSENLLSAGILSILTIDSDANPKLIFDASGIPVEHYDKHKHFSHLILSFSTIPPKQARQLHQILGNKTSWIKCASRINPSDFVAEFFDKIGRPLCDSDCRSNAFLNMAKVLEQHIYIEKNMLADFMTACLEQHPEDSWGSEVRGQAKSTLISVFNTIIAPRMLELEHAALLSLLNEVSNTWELSLSQSQYFISSNLWT